MKGAAPLVRLGSARILDFKIAVNDYLRILRKDALNAANGWASIIGGLLLYFMPKFGLDVEFLPGPAGDLAKLVASIFCAWMIILLFKALFYAPVVIRKRKNWLKLNVSETTNDEDEFGTTYFVAVYLKNDCDVLRNDCFFKLIQSSPPLKGLPIALRWNFSLQPKETLPIKVFFYRHFHLAVPNNAIRISVPLAPVYGGGIIEMPEREYNVEFEVTSAKAKPKRLLCRVFLDEMDVLRLERVSRSCKG